MAALWVVAMLAVLACGCAGQGKGPTDQELIAGTLADWKAAFEAQDIDQIMAAYSEDFEGERSADKAGVRGFFTRAIDAGYMDSAEIILDDAETLIDGETATVSPVDLSGDFGSVSLELILQKEADGAWRIIASERY